MSRARECFGASGLSLLLNGWALDLKMLALFILGSNKGGYMKFKIVVLLILIVLTVVINVITNYRYPGWRSDSIAIQPINSSQKESNYIIRVYSDSPKSVPGSFVEGNNNSYSMTYIKNSHEDLHNGFTGAYMVVRLDGTTTSQSVEGKTPVEYTVSGTIVSCSFQRKNVAQSALEKFQVEILKDGQVVAQSETTANFGVVTAATR